MEPLELPDTFALPELTPMATVLSCTIAQCSTCLTQVVDLMVCEGFLAKHNDANVLSFAGALSASVRACITSKKRARISPIWHRPLWCCHYHCWPAHSPTPHHPSPAEMPEFYTSQPKLCSRDWLCARPGLTRTADLDPNTPSEALARPTSTKSC